MTIDELNKKIYVTAEELAKMSGMPPDDMKKMLSLKILPEIKNEKDIAWLRSIANILNNEYLASTMFNIKNKYLETAAFLFPDYDYIELYAAKIIIERKLSNSTNITGYVIDKLMIKYNIDIKYAKRVVTKVYNSISSLKRRGSVRLKLIHVLLD